MNPGLLDINDCNLQLWHGDQHLQSPGYALLSGSEYQFGTPALQAARLKPRDISTRYWWQLSTESLQPGLGAARHSADLVHAHLNALHQQANQPNELILAVPGSMQREQLALLLGIIASCPFNAVGLVHRSVAVASLFPPGGTLYHVEVQLHQSLLSKLSADGSNRVLERSIALPGVGLMQLQERLVEVVADAFLRQTRFDPRRQAATEQQLYDALPGALQALRQAAEANIEIGGYTAHIERQDAELIAQPLYDNIAKNLSAGLLIADPIAGLLPGLEKAFPEVQILDEIAVKRAVELQGDNLLQSGEQLDFVTHLPSLSTALAAGTPSRQAALAAAQPPSIEQATHLLQRGSASPLHAQGTSLAAGWSLQLREAHWQLHGDGAGIQVNGSSADAGQTVTAGDIILIGAEAPFTLIAVQG